MFPNDVAVGPDGAIYMTDSGVLEDDIAPGGVPSRDWLSLTFDGKVFRIDPVTGAVTCLTRGLQFTNGLAFSPDEALFINETLTGNVYRLAPDGGRILFGNVVAEPRAPDEFKGPDGMKFAADGRLFCCVFGQGDVTVLDSTGKLDTRLPVLGRYPTNLVFGGSGEGAIYVTEIKTGSIQRIVVGCDGLPLHGQPAGLPRIASNSALNRSAPRVQRTGASGMSRPARRLPQEGR